jgi:electron transfer flavoprotein beta subunit
MNIIVTIKQVPSTPSVSIDSHTGTMNRAGVPSIMNPADKHALEAGLQLKTMLNEATTITALSMGPPQADVVLREALAMGADRAVLLCDAVFAGADTLATAYTLSRAIRRLRDFDIILCGNHSMDGETGQVGPQLAGFLDLPQVTHADSIAWGRERRLTIRSRFDCQHRIVDVPPPVLITVSKSINTPRYKTMNGVLRAFRDKTVKVWSQNDLDLNPMRIGINGSPTRVQRVFRPTYESQAAIHTGDAVELAEGMVSLLTNNHFI